MELVNKFTVWLITVFIVCQTQILAIAADEVKTNKKTVTRKWGDLSGVIQVSGNIKPPQGGRVKYTLKNGKVIEKTFFDQTVLVNPNNKGLSNVIIWLKRSGQYKFPIHPVYLKSKEVPVAVTVKYGKWSPRIILLQTKQLLVASNDDNVSRSVGLPFATSIQSFSYVPNFKCPYFSRRYSHKEHLPYSFNSVAYLWEKGVLFIQDHPYMVVSKSDGSFDLSKVPAGTWKLKFWHEKIGYLPATYQSGKKKINKDGTILITVKPGQNDLGTFIIKAGLLITKRKNLK